MKYFSKARRFGYAVASNERGVTLIELLVVMVIIGILAAIAYPSYQRQIAKTHRNAAAACLSQIAQALERRYTTNLSYVNPAGNTENRLGCTVEGELSRFYAFSFPAGSPTQSTYRIEAQPTAVQISRDRPCGTLALRNDGARVPADNACW